MRRLIAALLLANLAFANSHREAPTWLDQTGAITDLYVFVGNDPSKITFALRVDSDFDPTLLYAIKIDKDGDGKEDLAFEVRFRTEISAEGPRRTYSVSPAR